jgi:hypothetical protein
MYTASSVQHMIHKLTEVHKEHDSTLLDIHIKFELEGQSSGEFLVGNFGLFRF